MTGTEYTGDTYAMTLNAGWNVFANPFCHPLSWGQNQMTLTCNGQTRPLKHIFNYKPDSDMYDDIDADGKVYIKPWSAYMIKMDEPGCILTFHSKK